EIKGITARGYRTPNGFIVLKGSHAVLKERASSRKYTWPSNMRKKLLEDEILVVENDRLVFTADEEFSSPSAAATVIHGGHANGLTAWKNSQGITLKKLESK
ncbi:hypothetical protein BVY01_02775, partial [bacterium I07]